MKIGLVCFLIALFAAESRAQNAVITTYATSSVVPGIAAGPDGALWFTEPDTNKIGRITTSGTIIEYAVPSTNSRPYGITTGSDGALWFTESLTNKIGRITISGSVSEFTLPPPQGLPNFSLGVITTGSDGALWFAISNSLHSLIGRITTNGVFNQFPLPLAETFTGGITTGPDGALWATESPTAYGSVLGSNPNPSIVRIATDGTMTSYFLPNLAVGGYGIAAGPDGALWFTEAFSGAGTPVAAAKIGRITTSGAVTEFPLPSAASQPYGITAGPDGALWFVESETKGNGKIGRISSTGAITEYSVATPTYNSGGVLPPYTTIATGSDGNLWFTGTSVGLGRASLVSGAMSRVGGLAQIAAGGGWDTSIYLINNSSAPINVSVIFRSDDGTSTNLPLSITQHGSTQSTTASTINQVLGPNATLLIGTGSPPSPWDGWADVLSTGNCSGFAVFRYAPQGLTPGPGIVTPWEATVPLQTQLSSVATIVPFDNTGGLVTGAAMANLTNAPANLTLTFYDDSGNVIGGPEHFSLAANGHSSFVLNTTFTGTAGKRGIMVATGAPLVGLGLRAAPYGTLTSVPTVSQ